MKHTSYEARERFVAMLCDIGAVALPTIKAGLERLEPKLGVPGALTMAEDLLRAVPEVPDEELAHVIVRYVKSNVNSLALVATQALPKAWGVRARPLLLQQIHHKNEDVAIEAIKRLRKYGGVDVELLEQLRPIITGSAGSRPNVRHAAVEACEDATADAMQRTRTLLVQAMDTLNGTTPDVEDMVVLVSNVIVAVEGDPTAIALRCRQSTPHLRARLEAVLKRAKLPGHG